MPHIVLQHTGASIEVRYVQLVTQHIMYRHRKVTIFCAFQRRVIKPSASLTLIGYSGGLAGIPQRQGMWGISLPSLGD